MNGIQQPSTHGTHLNQRLDVAGALQAAGLGVWEIDMLTHQLAWDERCRLLVGISQTDALPLEQLRQYIHANDAERVINAFYQAMRPDSTGCLDETYSLVGTGEEPLRWVRFWGQRYITPDGASTRFAGVAQEVTKEVLAHNQLSESESRLKLLNNTVPAAIFYLNAQQRYQAYNNTFMDWFGVQSDEAIGKTVREFIGETAYQSVEPHLAKAYAGQQERYEVVAPLRLGAGRWLDIVYTPHKDDEGNVLGVFVHATEATNAILARQQLQETTDQMRTMIDSAPFPIGVYIGRELRIRFANKAIIDVYGKGDDVVGKLYPEILPELATQGIFEQLAEVYDTGTPFDSGTRRVNIEHQGVLVPYYFNYNFTPLFDATGQVYGVMNTAADVTPLEVARQAREESEERYRQLSTHLEEQVQQRTGELATANEKMVASNEQLLATNRDFSTINRALEAANLDLTRSNQNLEQFAYIASHDLQEPLRKIQQFGDLLKSRFTTQGGEELLYLERMQSAASRMSLLIRDLLAFSRISTSQAVAQAVALNAVIDQAIETLSVAIEESGAQIDVASLPVVQGDPSQLNQLFQNLLSNALKFRHVSTGESVIVPYITIRSHVVRSNEMPPSLQPARYAKAYHCIEVADNGIGFEEKYLDRIFQVFQRLHGKNEFAGTGVGLAIVQKVVTNHGGAITAQSQLGHGATFSVYLPI